MTRLLGVMLAGGAFCAAAAQAEPLLITMQPCGTFGQTTLFRADVSNVDLGTIHGVRITDLNAGGGSSGVFSGFDLDFIFFDLDGKLATADDRILPMENHATQFMAGEAREDAKGGPSRYQPTASHPGPLFGVLPDGSIDYATATLAAPDASYRPGVDVLSVDTSCGWVSLGDGGEISIRFPLISVGTGHSLYLFIGDAGLKDESSHATSEIQLYGKVGDPPIPVPPPGEPPALVPRLGPGKSLDIDARAVEGDIEKWEWDLDGDGQFDDAFGPLLTVSYEYLTDVMRLPLIGPAQFSLRATMKGGETTTPPPSRIELVPDPATWLLLGAAAPLLLRRRRKA